MKGNSCRLIQSRARKSSIESRTLARRRSALTANAPRSLPAIAAAAAPGLPPPPPPNLGRQHKLQPGKPVQAMASLRVAGARGPLELFWANASRHASSLKTGHAQRNLEPDDHDLHVPEHIRNTRGPRWIIKNRQVSDGFSLPTMVDNRQNGRATDVAPASSLRPGGCRWRDEDRGKSRSTNPGGAAT